MGWLLSYHMQAIKAPLALPTTIDAIRSDDNNFEPALYGLVNGLKVSSTWFPPRLSIHFEPIQITRNVNEMCPYVHDGINFILVQRTYITGSVPGDTRIFYGGGGEGVWEMWWRFIDE